jgi:hypothetical protein
MVEQNTKWLVENKSHRKFFWGGIVFCVLACSVGYGKSVLALLTVSDKIELFKLSFGGKVSNVCDQDLLACSDGLDRMRIERVVRASREPVRKNG